MALDQAVEQRVGAVGVALLAAACPTHRVDQLELGQRPSHALGPFAAEGQACAALQGDETAPNVRDVGKGRRTRDEGEQRRLVEVEVDVRPGGDGEPQRRERVVGESDEPERPTGGGGLVRGGAHLLELARREGRPAGRRAAVNPLRPVERGVPRRRRQGERGGGAHGLGDELERLALAPLVLTEGGGGVHHAPDRQAGRQRAHAPGDALDAPDADLEGGALLADGARRLQRVGEREQGRRMALAEGLERADVAPQRIVDLRSGQHCVGGDERHGHRMARRVRVDRCAKRGQPLHVEGEPRSLRVAAEAPQVLGGLPQPLHGRDAGRRAHAALALGDDVDGLVVALQQLRGDDAHHARMPRGILHDERRGVGVGDLEGTREHLVLDASPLLVASVEVDGELARATLAGGDEELEP